MTVVAKAELAQSYRAQASTGRFFRSARMRKYGGSPPFLAKGVAPSRQNRHAERLSRGVTPFARKGGLPPFHYIWCSRVARKLIFGQRSMVSARFTREGARYTSAPA